MAIVFTPAPVEQAPMTTEFSPVADTAVPITTVFEASVVIPEPMATA